MQTILLDILPMGINVSFFKHLNKFLASARIPGGKKSLKMCYINTKYIPYKKSESRCDGLCKGLLGFFQKCDPRPWDGGVL